MKNAAVMGQGIGYIVDGLDIKSEYKFSMYDWKSYQDLEENFDLYEQKCAKEREERR